MKILITGASGFIGSHLADRLCRSGHDVYCLVRESSDLTWLQGLQVHYLTGDCTSIDCVSGSERDFDFVFHLAGLTKSNKRDDYYRVNADGTMNMVRWASENCSSLKRFVYLSSLAAFGPGTGSGFPDDDRACCPVSDYGRSKLEGEDAVMSYSDRIGTCILRPSAVYGPRDREFFLVFQCVRNRIMPYWGDGYTSMIYIEELIDALVMAAEIPAAAGGIYNISDGSLYSNREIIDTIAKVYGVNVLKLRVPRALLPAIGFFGDKISKMMNKKIMINSDKVKELGYANWTCGIESAKHDLGFKPAVDMKEGFKWTADWYRIQGWL
ncbi:MAG: NAD(P)-dependent oxidoreductase [Nitrospira sp.]|nr:NAD(P)-dependent oxidoreductase [Nitrospira sp.]